MARINKQVVMLFDLNKCLGCQTCTSACKSIWTDRNAGQMYQFWNNVETQPGRGYPKNWQTLGGGFPNCGNQVQLTSPLPSIRFGYGAAWEYNYDQVLMTGGGDATAAMVVPTPEPSGASGYSSNWDEDIGAGRHPDSFYFYLPRICNHCTKPGCLAACPRKAIYKRAEDGIVLVDQNRCRGYRHCVKGCPYKKVYWNPAEKVSQKCIFCYPRIEPQRPGETPAQFQARRGGNFCATQCVGRIRYTAYAQDTASNAYKLIHGTAAWPGVALRLHPEFGTEPNTYYIPPLSAPVQAGTQQRLSPSLLAQFFGDTCGQTMAERTARVAEVLAVLEAERAKGPSSELVRILTAYSETDRIQL